MAHKTDIATIGHIFLTLGIFGYYTNQFFLGYPGLLLALLCYARQLHLNYRDYLAGKRETVKTEEQQCSPMQTASEEPTITIS